jgi:hypothetical protein
VNDVNDDDDVTCMIDYTSRQPELGNILYPWQRQLASRTVTENLDILSPQPGFFSVRPKCYCKRSIDTYLLMKKIFMKDVLSNVFCDEI